MNRREALADLRKTTGSTAKSIRTAARDYDHGGLGTILGGIAIALMVLTVIAAVLATVWAVWALGGLVVLLAWNLGVVNIVAASGGSVGTIGFFTAVGAYVVLSLIRSIFRPTERKA